jgi:hypothetical protein
MLNLQVTDFVRHKWANHWEKKKCFSLSEQQLKTYFGSMIDKETRDHYKKCGGCDIYHHKK